MDPFLPEADWSIWMGTNRESRKVRDIQENPRVALYYYSPDHAGYVAVYGTAHLVDEPEEKASRWKDEWESFYPDRESQYLLIQVIPERLEVIDYSRGIQGDPGTWEAPSVHFSPEPPTMPLPSSGFELDHFFVAVPDPGSGSGAVEAAGFLISPPHPHPGQGTASRGILFQNAYIEFIWLTDADEAASPPIRQTRLDSRIDPGSGACPFGIGLRKGGEGEALIPFQTWAYRPPYLPEGAEFRMSASSVELGQPLVFFMPWLSGPGRPATEHPNRAEKVTKLEIVLVDEGRESETLTAMAEASVASFHQGPDFFAEVELDGGRAGKSLDLRPEIPLRLRW